MKSILFQSFKIDVSQKYMIPESWRWDLQKLNTTRDNTTVSLWPWIPQIAKVANQSSSRPPKTWLVDCLAVRMMYDSTMVQLRPFMAIWEGKKFPIVKKPTRTPKIPPQIKYDSGTTCSRMCQILHKMNTTCLNNPKSSANYQWYEYNLRDLTTTSVTILDQPG